jgi:hypothetical protein
LAAGIRSAAALRSTTRQHVAQDEAVDPRAWFPWPAPAHHPGSRAAEARDVLDVDAGKVPAGAHIVDGDAQLLPADGYSIQKRS